MASSNHWNDQRDKDSDSRLQTPDSESDSATKGQPISLSDKEDTDYGPLPSLSNVEINRKSVTKESKLGEGHFGTVYKGKLKTDDNDKLIVAIKILKADVTPAKQFLNEARIMHTLRHDRIVKLIGVCRETNPILLITEYLCNGDLGGFLKEDKGSTIKNNHLICFASQITDGMQYLESKGFVHRDLRCANVLVGKDRSVKIADFGLARLVGDFGEYMLSTDSLFPILWTAPEARTSGTVTSKSDVWSFGVLLYEMITYGDIPKENMQASVVQKPKPVSWPKEYFGYMKDCLNNDPDKRPSFSNLHGYFKEYYATRTKPQQSWRDYFLNILYYIFIR